MDFLQNYNGSIQAIAAILNLFFIGGLACYSHKLQRKNYTIEVYSRLQQEIKDCIREVNECIRYFSAREQKTSLYLYELQNNKDDEPYHVALAEHIISDIEEILFNLKTLKLLISELNFPLNLKDFRDKLLLTNLSKLNLFKHSLVANSPAVEYENHINGAESPWVDEEYAATKAFDEVKEIITRLEAILKSS